MNRRGFTLVELLAVIVILAIIMVIAIPAVLNTMQSAGRSTFETYARRIANETQKKFTEDSLNNSNTQAKIYNIIKDLGIDNTGDFKGYSIVSQKTNAVYLTLYNNDYAYVAINMSNANLKRELKTISSVDPNNLTPEYLCSVVEEYTSCSYTIIDEEGNETNNTYSPIKHEYDAMIGNVNTFRQAINDLIIINQVTEIIYSDSVPDGVTTNNGADPSSKYPIYVWNDGTKIYYSTEARNIYLPTNSSGLFKYFDKLTHMDTTKMRTDEVVNPDNMFYGDYSLEELDVSNWRFPNATVMSSMFYYCKKLKSLDISNWDLRSVTQMENMFCECNELSGTLDMSKFNFSNLNNLRNAFSKCLKLEYIKFPINSKSNLSTMERTFYQCSELKKIYNIENLDVYNLRYITGIFSNCSSLESLDLSKWNAENLLTVESAFNAVGYTGVLNISGFNLSKVESFNGMFQASKIEEVIFGDRNWISAKSLWSLFYNCHLLKRVDLSNLKINNATNIRHMFCNCYALEDLNITGMEGKNIENLFGTFANCKLLKNIDLSSLNTTNVTNMMQTFYYCQNLESLDISGIKSKNIEILSNTFSGCAKLHTIYASKEWSLESINPDESITPFHQCSSLPGFNMYNISYNYAKSKEDGGYFTIKG